MVKKVLFVSFLTLALCYSQAPDHPDKQASQLPVVVPPAVKNAETEQHVVAKEPLTKPAKENNDTASIEMAPNNKISKPESNKTSESAKSPETPKEPATPVVTASSTEVPTASGTIAPTSNATDVPATNKTVVPSTDKNETTTAVPPKIDTTTSTTTTVAPVSTEKTTNGTTEKAAVTTSEPTTKIVQARGFDGASFIGGMILTLGLLAVGFVGFKYYRNKTERNYHTL